LSCSDSFFRDLPPNSPLRNPLSFFTDPPPVVPPLLLPPAADTGVGCPEELPSDSPAFCFSFPLPFLLLELVETADVSPNLAHARFFSLPSFVGDGPAEERIVLADAVDRLGLVLLMLRGGRDD
jgi:hypothetical protein